MSVNILFRKYSGLTNFIVKNYLDYNKKILYVRTTSLMICKE